MLRLLLTLLLCLPPGAISAPQNPENVELSAYNYDCLDARLSTKQAGPFKTALSADQGAASHSRLDSEKEVGEGEGRYSSVAAALGANGAPELPEAITILKDGTLCFRGNSNNFTSTQRAQSIPEGHVYRDSGDQGAPSTFGDALTGVQEESVEKDLRTAGRRMAGREGGVGDAELNTTNEQDVRVDPEMSTRFPFTAIGGLENGCTGSLIGRCHVLTAGHCVLHPTEFKISKELKFTPAQNGGKSAAPFGTFDFIDVKVARRWAIFSDPAHDIALIHIKGSGDLVDKRLGYLHVGDGGKSDELANLNLAGYPEDKEDGHLWYDFCREIPFIYGKRRFINHSCRVEKGNSGSPLWVYNSESGVRQTRAVHVAELTYGRRLDDNFSEVVESSPQAVILSGSVLQEIHMWMKEMPCT